MNRQQEQPLIGEAPVFLEVLERVSRVAQLNRPVLVIGERGTGKEWVARAIHEESAEEDSPLVCVNCAAFASNLLENELFGHEKGAFTDAHETRVGKFELASGGTLFLDEIGDMSLAGQAKLLRVIETGELQRVGYASFEGGKMWEGTYAQAGFSAGTKTADRSGQRLVFWMGGREGLQIGAAA